MVETEIEPRAHALLLATFFVGNTLCALDASRVQEVLRVGSVTRIRQAPDQVAGVINLRGKIVTLLDLGMRLGEGTGAALAMKLIQAAVAAFTQMATFATAGVSNK